VKIPTGRYQQMEGDARQEAKSLSPTKELINIINENTEESSQEGRPTIEVRSSDGNNALLN
jgi:hypothetical protein